MTKKFCDCCGSEITGQSMPIEVPCHLYSLKGKVTDGYTDGNGYPFSGRYDKVDLCNRCANSVFYAAVAQIEKLKREALNE